MNKLLLCGTLIAATLISSQASAAVMECYVDTQAYDVFTSPHCQGMIYGARKANTSFRVSDTNKQINTVVWSDKATSCGSTSSTLCTIEIKPFGVNKATATILYADGTWEKVSATASFENGK